MLGQEQRRQWELELPWAGVGDSGGAKAVQVLRKNTSDEQRESNVGEEGRSGGSQQVRRQQKGLRTMRTRVREEEREPVATRVGCEVHPHGTEAVPGPDHVLGVVVGGRGWSGREESLGVRVSRDYETW